MSSLTHLISYSVSPPLPSYILLSFTLISHPILSYTLLYSPLLYYFLLKIYLGLPGCRPHGREIGGWGFDDDDITNSHKNISHADLTQCYFFVRSCPWWTMKIPGCGLSLYWLEPSLPLLPPISSLSLSIYKNPKNIALLCFLIFCKPSSRFCNVNIGERNIFAVVAMKKKKTIPLPIEPLLPSLTLPFPVMNNGTYLRFYFSCTEREQNIFWNYLKIKSSQQVKPGKILWNEPSNPQNKKNWINLPHPINFDK